MTIPVAVESLENLRALVIVLIVLVAALILVFLAILSLIRASRKIAMGDGHSQRLLQEIEQLLSNGQTFTAKSAALDLKTKQPKNAEVCMLLGRSQFQLGELIEAKGTFEEILTFSPDFGFRVQPWLDRIAELLSSQRPRGVG